LKNKLGMTGVIWRIIQRRLKITSSQEWKIIMPHGIGDTYLVCALAYSILEERGGNSFTAMVKESHVDVAAMFPGVSIILVNDKLNLKRINKLSKLKKGYPFIGHPWHHELGHITGYKGLTLLDSHRILFKLSERAKLSLPVIKDEWKNSALQRFENYGLIKGRTVILAPEAVTLPIVDKAIWETIAQLLKNEGYIVAANASREGISTIPGTIPIWFPLGEAIPMAELAGWVIALRSGFCDLIAAANCRLDVIYPPHKTLQGTAYDMFSLLKMGLSTTAREHIVTEDSDTNAIIKQILQ